MSTPSETYTLLPPREPTLEVETLRQIQKDVGAIRSVVGVVLVKIPLFLLILFAIFWGLKSI
jgi:hypothetical protein